MQLGLFDPPADDSSIFDDYVPPRIAASTCAQPLRPYQQKAVDGIHEQLRENQSTLVVMATGTGKTHVFANFAHRWPERDYARELSDRVLVLAHRYELLDQARNTLERLTGEQVGLEKAESRAGLERIVVASVQTLYSEERLRQWKPDSFGLVVYDECHHALAPKNRAIPEYFSAAKLIGFTATPDRTDEKALGQLFVSEKPAFVYEIDDAIADGWLVEPRIVPLYLGELDLSAAKGNGDFTKEDLDAAMVEEVIAHMAKATIAESGDLKTLAFTTSVDNADRYAELLNEMKAGSARSVNGKTPTDERRQILEGFERGDFQYLPNVGIATEGYDCVPAACVAQGRPTKSRWLHTQIVGRVLRPMFPPGFDPNVATADERKAAIARSPKPFARVLEFTGNSGRHSLACTVDMLGGKYDDDVVEDAKKKTRENPGMRATEALEQAKSEKEEKIRNAAARKLLLHARANYTKGREYNPFSLMGMKRTKSDVFADRFGGSVASEAQIKWMQDLGIRVPPNCTKYQANRLLTECQRRKKQGLALISQIDKLNQIGIDATNLSYKQACDLCWELKRNNNKIPSAAVVDGILNRERQAGEDG